MKTPGRPAVVAMVSFFAVLLLIPPIYLASAALLESIDKAALDRRIEDLNETAVASPADLQTCFRQIQTELLPILPPCPSGVVDEFIGITVFDPKDFEGWLDALEPAEIYGVTVYPVIVTEDPETLDTVFLNSSWKEIDCLAAEKDYEPFDWAASWCDPVWAEVVYDTPRIDAIFYLLPAEDVEAMAEAQLAAEYEEEPGGIQMMMGEGMPESVTNIVIFAIESATNGMALGIGWPDDFTNNLEVFARDTPAIIGWSVASTNLSTAGTNSQWWVDTSVISNTEARFYLAGDAQTDSDNDGLTDARERRIWGTDECSEDSDGDGFSDYLEAFELNTDPNNDDTNKPNVTIIFPANDGQWIWMP